jgi:hypothetical protein
MADFLVRFKLISCDGGLAKLTTLGGREFCVPADFMPSGAAPSSELELPLGQLAVILGENDRKSLGRALLGWIEN